MNNQLSFLDYLVFVIYFIIVAGYGYSIYRKRKKMNMMQKLISLRKERLPGGPSALL